MSEEIGVMPVAQFICRIGTRDGRWRGHFSKGRAEASGDPTVVDNR